ncbi:hypothetical protein Acr_00g0047130 [Actinidia rufa]|uniref:Retrotransposon gag domain-containing protein n=1 Tax=Actinidia rufa TaxID=165716 RepID=A0A7J0DLJ8_9ERIC|nr:hypothetical protein Acr_00g0047130 [Actinidia rufa]
MHLLSHLLPRLSASNPLDDRAHPMTNTNQALDLEDLYCEIHSMTEQMRTMNETNALLIQHLTINNPPPPPPAPGREVRRRGRSPCRGDQLPRHRNKSTTQRIRDLNAQIDAINTGASVSMIVDALIKHTEPPFTDRVMRIRVFSKFKLPTQLGVYEGKIDPMHHLDSYKSLMALQRYSDEVMCKAFSTTLKGSVRLWYKKLSLGTIDSFDDLSKLFIANFMSCRVRQKNASHLFTVHQKEIESLKDYVKWFNQAVLEVDDPNDKVVVMAMMEGLRLGPLFDSLSKNVPETLSILVE